MPAKILVFPSPVDRVIDLLEILFTIVFCHCRIDGPGMQYIAILQISLDVVAIVIAFFAIAAAKDRRCANIHDFPDFFVSVTNTDLIGRRINSSNLMPHQYEILVNSCGGVTHSVFPLC
jgi:hypothetical protein